MRGIAEITLTDASTGEVERRVEANMVTNAVQDLVRLNPAGLKSSPIPWGLPLVGNAIGGVLLFDQKMEEDADKYYAPPEVWPIGYSSNDVDTSGDPLRGSYNAAESGAVDGGYRLVFDFPTDRANGTLRSVCLTSAVGGRAYFGSKTRSTDWAVSAGSWSLGDTPKVEIAASGAFDGEHFFGASQVKGRETTWMVWDKPVSRVPIAAGYDIAASPYSEKAIETDTWFKESGYRDSEGKLYDVGGDGRRYESGLASGCFSGGDHYRWRYNSGSSAVKFLRIRAGAAREWEAAYDGVALGHASGATVANGLLYAPASDGSGVWALPLDGGAGTFAPLPDGASATADNIFVATPFDGGPVYAVWDTGAAAVHGNAMAPVHSHGASGYKISYLHAYKSADSSRLYCRSMRVGPYLLRAGYEMSGNSSYLNRRYINLAVAAPYLATIDNLSSPVVKTERHTMKIAYTLYDE